MDLAPHWQALAAEESAANNLQPISSDSSAYPDFKIFPSISDLFITNGSIDLKIVNVKVHSYEFS